jgi:hypothetical protein
MLKLPISEDIATFNDHAKACCARRVRVLGVVHGTAATADVDGGGALFA